MRVLHVIPSIGPLRGGPSIAMGTIARALRDAGIQVDVATTNDNDRELLDVPIGEPVDEAGVRYWYFARTAYPYTTSTGLARWLRSNAGNYDVVHAHALFSFATPIAANAARRHGKPYIIRPLGTLAHYGMQQHAMLKRLSWLMVERPMLKQAAAVHFTSEAERRDAERLGDWRSVVVPLGVAQPDGPPRRPRNDAGTTFLFLSRIHPKKRVDLLLEAFAQMREQRTARLIIAGAGHDDYLHEMQGRAEALGLGDAVRWAGHVSGAEKERVIAEADVFVLPSINENFGIAPVEALAAGLPVLLTRGVAIHEEVQAYRAGLVAEDTPESVSGAMLDLCDARTRAEMSVNALRLAREKFSIEAMQRGLVAMYEKVVTA